MANRSRNLLLTVATVLMIFSFGKVGYGQCPNALENIVVQEGTENTIVSCGLGPNGEKWVVRPTSRATRDLQITNFTDTVNPAVTGLYAINQTGLIIRNATIDPTATDPISTAGVYYVTSRDGNITAFKLVVIRSGPDCSFTRSASGGTNLTCTIIYADHPVSPMDATITCIADGQVYTGTPTKTLIKPYLYDSTTVITISNSSAETYDCRATFTAPDNNKTTYLAGNKPNYTANVTVMEATTTTAQPTTTTLRTGTTQPTTTNTNTTPSPVAITTQTGTTQPTTTNTNTTPSPVAITTQTGTTQPTTTNTNTTPSPVAITTQTGTTQPTTTNTNTTPSPVAITTQTGTTQETIRYTITNPSPVGSVSQTGATTLSSTGTSQIPASTYSDLTSSIEPSVSPTRTEGPLTSHVFVSESTNFSSTSNLPSSTLYELKSTSAEIPPIFFTTGSIDVGLLAAKVTLGAILGTLMAAAAAIGGLFGFIFFCPLFAATSIPAGHIVGDIQRLPRREWIPVRREIRRMEYRVIPFYRQTFCRCPTPYDYRLPSQGRRVQACLAQPRIRYECERC